MPDTTSESVRLLVSLNGCDDSTEFVVIATPEQWKFLDLLAARSFETSTYHCMPVLEVTDNEAAIERALKADDE